MIQRLLKEKIRDQKVQYIEIFYQDVPYDIDG